MPRPPHRSKRASRPKRAGKKNAKGSWPLRQHGAAAKNRPTPTPVSPPRPSEQLLESSFPEQLSALRSGPIQYLDEAKVLKGVIDGTSAVVSHDGKRALLEFGRANQGRETKRE